MSQNQSRGKGKGSGGGRGQAVYTPRIKTETESLMTRFRVLNPQMVRVTRMQRDVLLEEVYYTPLGGGAPQWRDAATALQDIPAFEAAEELSSFKSRALTRLEPPVVINTRADFDALTEAQKVDLRMTQAQWAAHKGAAPPNGGAKRNAGGRGAGGN